MTSVLAHAHFHLFYGDVSFACNQTILKPGTQGRQIPCMYGLIAFTCTCCAIARRSLPNPN